MTRSLLLASCALLSGLTATTAWAQQAPAAGNATASQAAPAADDHEIVVSGVRASLSTAIGIKRNAYQIVDSIVAEDIGKLPDNNVAEALQRVTGVQITRSQGEGSGVAIRGLSQVQQLVNGRDYFTTSGRTIALGDIPAALLAGVDVYKTSSADQIEGGIGGVVDIRLRRPFDFKGSEKSITAKGFYGDIAKKVDPRVSALWSNRFDTSVGEVGLLVSAAYQARHYGSFRNATGAYQTRTDLLDLNGNGQQDAGDAITAVTDAGTRYTNGSRKRWGVNASAQWRPASNLEFYLDGAFERVDNREDNLTAYVRTGTSGFRASPATAVAPFTFAPGTNYFQYGSYANAKFAPATYAQDSAYTTYQIALGGKWEQDRLKITGEGNYTRSSGWDDMRQIGIYANAPSYTLDLRNFIPNPQVSGFNPNDFNAYRFDNFQDEYHRNVGEEVSGRLDATYELGGFLRNLQAGLRYARRTSHHSGFTNDYSLSDRTDLPLPGNVKGLLTTTPNQVFRGDYNLSLQQFALPNINLVRDIAFARQLFGFGPGTPADDPSQLYDIAETTYAAYLMANYSFTLGGIQFDGNAGLRYVKTKESVTGFQNQQGGGYAPINANSDYGSWLPSANIRAKLTEKLYLRGAISKVVTRPAFSQLTPAQSLAYAFLTGSAGNPNLKPLKADQFDTSLEWYISKTNILYAAAFLKKVDGFIQNVSTQETINGQPFLMTRPVNGNNGTVKGIEVGYQTFFDFLPAPFNGLGLQANYTFVDSHAPSPIPGQSVPLEGLSRNSYNLIGIYEKGPVSVRVAYNWRSKYVETTSGDAANRPLIYKPIGQLDASISYDLTKKIAITFDATNLTRNTLNDYYGTPLLPKSVNAYDRTFEFGVRAKF
ncbi:TonB-dependent receptor [Novosphingobium rosa]|uniref:TonB-dependent receptor n=1 Tax=Novosphingobium rosa TaxID=76978 RepID=UPI00082BBCD9|nr:TonB-dependent receptor [Novosphingobium rosa]